ncbi:MAG: phosphatidylglycerophosphatase and protein-tyrosine phosphatase 1 family protein [Pirellulales bacterium]
MSLACLAVSRSIEAPVSLPRVVSRLLFWPTYLWNVLLGRVLRVRRWWDRIDHHVILGALPREHDVPQLVAEGVCAVVNTCEEYAGPTAAYRTAGIEQLRVPTTDFHPPSLEHVRTAVEFIQRHVTQGHTVYVHCKAGRARSATVVLCWLIAHRGMTPAAAQAHLRARRPHVMPQLDQRVVVQEWQEEVAGGTSGQGATQGASKGAAEGKPTGTG